MIGEKELLIDFLKYMGAILFWSNVMIAFIAWDLDNMSFRAMIVFAIMFMTGKYMEKEDR